MIATAAQLVGAVCVLVAVGTLAGVWWAVLLGGVALIAVATLAEAMSGTSAPGVVPVGRQDDLRPPPGGF